MYQDHEPGDNLYFGKKRMNKDRKAYEMDLSEREENEESCHGGQMRREFQEG